MEIKKISLILFTIVVSCIPAFAQNGTNYVDAKPSTMLILLLVLILLVLLAGLFFLYVQFRKQGKKNNQGDKEDPEKYFSEYLKSLDNKQIKQFMKLKSKASNDIFKGDGNSSKIIAVIVFLASLMVTSNTFAQTTQTTTPSLNTQPGIIITLILAFIPILLGCWFAIAQAINAVKKHQNKRKIKEAEQFAKHLATLNDKELETQLIKRQVGLDFALSHNELSGNELAEDSKGILQHISSQHDAHFVAYKKKATPRPALEPAITKLILWYFGCAAFWLVVGGTIGEYVGIKFVVPDADHVSWLSFGRLRPVHTNMVFWGWASIGMIGLGFYVVPTVSNTTIYSIKWGWISLILINIMVVIGSLSLMAGINNGGGEFREYIWPIMAFFAVALILTFINFYLTVAKRTTKEIYISNWFIISAILFTIIIALTAYLPYWQNGIGETIVQGYYMHAGVGMWFTLFVVGLLYYFIPQQLNRPIYAYSLGILAFWTQILFYTIIGTHHFIFSAIPWWLQTVAIVGSGGMIIPVVAATINFVMTFKGQWNKVANSYTLPFFLVVVVYYFIVSMQGTAQAFKFTNLLWHFTDFTVAHSHLGFYGIITFAIWGGIYAIVPRLTGIEPKQQLVGTHFWLAFVGLLFYAVPLSYGATLKGLMWMEGKPFIDSVVVMFEYWVWRAVGGSLMFISHLVFAYNLYKMIVKGVPEIDVKDEAFKILATKTKL